MFSLPSDISAIVMSQCGIVGCGDPGVTSLHGQSGAQPHSQAWHRLGTGGT